MREPELADHFGDLATQTHAARFGVWVFLASEALLFAGLFTLYAAYRAHHPQAFADGIHHNNALLGTTNTVILITSSFSVAMAVVMAERGRRGLTMLFLLITLAFAAAFLVVKGFEYSAHLGEGIAPGGRGAHFTGNAPGASAIFWTLYYVTTGTHALHVVIGMVLLSLMTFRVATRRATPLGVDLSALYWHLVDLIWIFLWPLFYLTGGGH